jgi:hypothetical protein
VTLPSTRATDIYNVVGTCAGVAIIFVMDCPDIAASDRTTTQFRVVTSIALTAGDQIDFLVQDR